MKYLLKNGTVVTGEKSEQLDILVEGEKIAQVGKNLPSEEAQEIDVSGKILFPGFIDGHTHFDLEVAGTVTADDFETGTKAAILMITGRPWTNVQVGAALRNEYLRVVSADAVDTMSHRMRGGVKMQFGKVL